MDTDFIISEDTAIRISEIASIQIIPDFFLIEHNVILRSGKIMCCEIGPFDNTF